VAVVAHGLRLPAYLHFDRVTETGTGIAVAHDFSSGVRAQNGTTTMPRAAGRNAGVDVTVTQRRQWSFTRASRHFFQQPKSHLYDWPCSLLRAIGRLFDAGRTSPAKASGSRLSKGSSVTSSLGTQEIGHRRKRFDARLHPVNGKAPRPARPRGRTGTRLFARRAGAIFS
jgi:hypothetical protein